MCLLVSGRRAHYVTNLLGRTISVARSEQDLPTGRVTVNADVAVPVPGRASSLWRSTAYTGPRSRWRAPTRELRRPWARAAYRLRSGRGLALLRGPCALQGPHYRDPHYPHGRGDDLRRGCKSTSGPDRTASPATAKRAPN